MNAVPAAFALFSGLLGLAGPAFGQVAAPEANLSASVAAAQKRYSDSFLGSPQLYNGPEYVDYALRYHARIGHQFFLTPEKQPGSVQYNNQRFGNLRLTYDVVLDQVVLPHPTSPLSLRLINEWVGGFSINGHRFVRLVADSASGKVLRTGYYEVLVDSTVQVLAKRAKRQQEQIVDRRVDVEFIPADRLFIKKGGVYHPVGTKAAVVRLLADRGQEVQRYIQEHNLQFNKTQREAATVELVRYYCSLRPQ